MAQSESPLSVTTVRSSSKFSFPSRAHTKWEQLVVLEELWIKMLLVRSLSSNGLVKPIQSIPEAFIKNFKRIIPKKATLFDHSKKTWHVKLEQTDGRLFFKNGWQHFARDHSLEFGDFLVFRYLRNSRFDVKIFGKNGCEKEVAVDRTISSSPGYIANKACSKRACSKRACIGKQKHLEISSGENEEACCSSKVDRYKSQGNVRINPEERKISKDLHFVVPKNPYFVQTIANHSKHVVYLPISVLRSLNIKLMPYIIIHTQNGNTWPVKVNFHNDGRMHFGLGWPVFINENNIEVGDQCVFEFVLGRENICKAVHVQLLHGNA